jgi:hypothetical protein
MPRWHSFRHAQDFYLATSGDTHMAVDTWGAAYSLTRCSNGRVRDRFMLDRERTFS